VTANYLGGRHSLDRQQSWPGQLARERRGEDAAARGIGDRVGVVWRAEDAVVLET
jgi:hypothetical protein